MQDSLQTSESQANSAPEIELRSFDRSTDPLPQILEKLRQPSNVLEALNEVARLGPLAIEALPTICALLAEAKGRIGSAAAKAIGQMGVEVLPTMVKLLSHRDRVVRREIVWAIARLGALARPAIPALCRALRDPDARTAAGAAQSLANLGPAAEPAVPDLIESLNTSNLVQSRLVAKALSLIGPKALPALLAAVEDPRPIVRHEAIVAIGFMGMRGGPAVPTLVQRLKALCNSRHDNLNQRKADEMSQTVATAVLCESLEPIQEILTLIETLGRIGPAASAARPVLEGLSNDPESEIREAARTALGHIAGWS